MKPPDAALVLEDGRSFRGRGIGAGGPALGEVVFNTSMTGYQEILSDPSYCGQIVVFTSPQIGNYGVCEADGEAPGGRPALGGVVLRELSPTVSSWRAQGSLEQWLQQHGIAGISEVDTRALTRHLRQRGALRGGIFRGAELDAALAQVRSQPKMEGLDLTGRVTTGQHFTRGADAERGRVVLLDFGVKQSILRCLERRQLAVEVVPASTSAEEILSRRPDGVVLSNGPGDPAAVGRGIQAARALCGRLPLLGICLGHQILALALGGRTFKLPFGHHGGNHPVADRVSGQVWITAQNHGFAVDPDSLVDGDLEQTQLSLYDGTLEGFASCERRLVAVQFHPEGGPGPSDAEQVFDRFVKLLPPVVATREQLLR